MLWEFHLNLKNCTCQCLYCVLWISGWQRSWDSVRRGNLPNVTEVKRKKKKNQDAHPSLLLAPDFWVWLPTQKFRAALNPHLFHSALLCHVSERTDDNVSGGGTLSLLEWRPPQVSAGLSVITDPPNIPKDLPPPSTRTTMISVTTAGGDAFHHTF